MLKMTILVNFPTFPDNQPPYPQFSSFYPHNKPVRVGLAACGILVPRPGIEPRAHSSESAMQSLNHLDCQGIPVLVLFYPYFIDEETDSEDEVYPQVGQLSARARA